MTNTTRPKSLFPSQSADALRLAAQILRERGWCRTGPENEAGEVCVIRAISLVTGENLELFSDTVLMFNDHLTLDQGKPFIVDWSDHYAADLDEVIEEMEIAALGLDLTHLGRVLRAVA